MKMQLMKSYLSTFEKLDRRLNNNNGQFPSFHQSIVSFFLPTIFQLICNEGEKLN